MHRQCFAGPELLAELPHAAIRDAGVSHAQCGAPGQTQERACDRQSEQQTRDETHRADPDERVADRGLPGLVKVDLATRGP